MSELLTLEKPKWAVPENPNQQPESEVRIRFLDCDPFGHLNNARYLDYFISAREEHLEEFYGFDIFGDDFKETGWVVRNSQLTHLIPAVYNQRVLIQTRLLNFSSSSIVLEGVMMDKERNKILATGWVEFRYFDSVRGRPARHEPELMEFFEKIHVGSDFSFGSEKKRIRELKSIVA